MFSLNLWSSWSSGGLPLEFANLSAGFLPLSLVFFAYERALTPIYSAAPTTFLLNKILLATVVIAALRPITSLSATRLCLYVSMLLYLAPTATYWVAVWTSRRKDPLWGPAVTHLVVLSPMVYIFSSFVMVLCVGSSFRQSDQGFETSRQPEEKTDLPSKLRLSILHRLIALFLCYSVSNALSRGLWSKISALNNVSDSMIFLALADAFFGRWLLGIKSTPSNLTQTKTRKMRTAGRLGISRLGLFIAFAVIRHHFLRDILHSPVLPHPLKQPYTHPTFPLRIHSSVQSTTGLIVVGEALPPPSYAGGDDNEMHSLRYLRASHSILGGVWMGAKIAAIDNIPPITDSYGTPLGDSIYSAFVLQEAVRLVNRTANGQKTWENALIIGLGAGTSAAALNRHGISTTIIEIDPAVYDAARHFFGFQDPGPGKVFLEDARAWVFQRRTKLEGQATVSSEHNSDPLYDIVIHDCFSGGAVPQHIFTVEFWTDLKALIHPDGVIVVNFAGRVDSDSSRMVLLTLEKSIGRCRAFHDAFGELSEEQYGAEFVNIVFFCTSSMSPPAFRQPRTPDFLGSPLRRHVLSTLPNREIDLGMIRKSIMNDQKELDGFILTDRHNPLGELQEAESRHHWRLMKDVLPNIFWETY